MAWATVRRAARTLRFDWALLLLSVGLSFGLWLFVTAEQNPLRTDVIPRPIQVQPVNVPAGLDVVGDIGAVSLRVVAPSDLWLRLQPSDFRATVDLSGRSVGEQQLPVSVAALDSRVRVLESTPGAVAVKLEPLAERQVPVKVNLQGSAVLGYVAEVAKVEPPTASVRGPASLVALVDAAVADVNIEGLRADFRQSAGLVPRNATGRQVEGLAVEPSLARVEVGIKQQIQFRSVPVLPRVQGAPAAGYQVAAVSVDPPAVPIAGYPEALQGVAFIQTVPVDVAGATGDVTANASLETPSGVSVIGPTQVAVKVTLERRRP